MIEAACHNTSPCLTNPPRTTERKELFLTIFQELAYIKNKIHSLEVINFQENNCSSDNKGCLLEI